MCYLWDMELIHSYVSYLLQTTLAQEKQGSLIRPLHNQQQKPHQSCFPSKLQQQKTQNKPHARRPHPMTKKIYQFHVLSIDLPLLMLQHALICFFPDHWIIAAQHLSEGRRIEPWLSDPTKVRHTQQNGSQQIKDIQQTCFQQCVQSVGICFSMARLKSTFTEPLPAAKSRTDNKCHRAARAHAGVARSHRSPQGALDNYATMLAVGVWLPMSLQLNVDPGWFIVGVTAGKS